ncbi:sialidase family protein [Sphingobacterium sp. SGG-5]|uniref:sialidase family protein n=1 Tax=Sphingobacterium sp. SGG-5 TaxID=2710881 RepID=UPI0019CF5069|nr:sialidase family protein [Sphingobacterium sp. SGG-5]
MTCFLNIGQVEAQLPTLKGIRGVAIAHIPASENLFIGSPSICILPDGTYVASHEICGPKSKATTYVFHSTDKGKNWKNVSEIRGQVWSNLFVYEHALYIVGTSRPNGSLVIRKSIDGGKTWSTPKDRYHGLIREGKYGGAPTPVAIHNGRLWKAMEYVEPDIKAWGKQYSALMMSVPLDSDFLNADNWILSNALRYNSSYLNGEFGGWLEGNAVISPSGEIVNVIRTHIGKKGGTDRAAIIRISEDGKKASFNPDEGFVEMPGGSKKFTIRYDSVSSLYWTVSNYVPEKYRSLGRPSEIRNTSALCFSKDLRTWTVAKVILQHTDTKKHGFQYVDWQFEGNDIIMVTRTAYDDGISGAKSFHDSNFMTFHRIKKFRRNVK